MTPQRYQQIGDVYHRAQALPREQRPAFLDEACRGDPELRGEVDSLLAAQDDATSFMGTPAVAVAARLLGDDPAPTRIGRYSVLGVLGRGGMGHVYLAEDAALGRKVAIKLLQPALSADAHALARFEQEARAASSLNHPNIVTIYEVGQAPTGRFIAMEYVEGRALSALTGTPMAVDTLLPVARQIARALAVAHAAGIVHRDIKPENIMLRSDGYVKLLDFGVARLLSARTEPHTTLTQPGLFIGTPRYMAPEQLRGEPATTATDIFSFGTVLYELETGRHPATVQGPPGSSTQSDRAPASAVSYRLGELIRRMLDPDPGRRPGAAEVEATLVPLSAGPSPGSTAEPERTAVARPVRGPLRAVGWTLAAAVVAGAAAAGAWVLFSGPRRDPPPTITPLTSYPGNEVMPTFSPDGNQVAFVWGGEKGENGDIYAVQIGSGTPLRLTTSPLPDFLPSWSPDGRHIAFVRPAVPNMATVYVVPPTGGAERKVADLTWTPTPTALSWSRDGNFLVADTALSSETRDIVLIPLHQGEIRPLLTILSSEGRYEGVALSHSGARLAFGQSSANLGEGIAIFVVDLDSRLSPKGRPRRITSFLPNVAGFAWAADDESIIYAANFLAAAPQLRRVPSAGGGSTPVGPGVTGLYPAVSRSGGRLAYAPLNRDVNLWRFEQQGPVPFGSSSFNDYDAQFSPDGTRLAFVSDRSGDLALWVAKADGTAPVQLTHESGRRPGSPRWSPDSRRLAYDDLADDGKAKIYVIDAAGGQSRRLTGSDDNENIPSWSRDGTWVYYGSNRTGRREVWRMRASGDGQPQQITDGGGSAPWESWDGTRLYFRRGSRLIERSLSGGEERDVLLALYAWAYVPVEDGIFYVVRELQGGFSLLFLDFATRKVVTLHTYHNSMANAGLTVSPDRKAIVSWGSDAPSVRAADLMMLAPFR